MVSNEQSEMMMLVQIFSSAPYGGLLIQFKISDVVIHKIIV